jgi:hypothetical protein
MLNGETMSHTLIGKERSSQVAYNLMHLNYNTSGILRVEDRRLHMRVDLAPLLRPISADFLRSMDKSTLERSRPSHVLSHLGKGCIDVSRVEGGVSGAQQLDFWCRLI